MKKLYKSLVPKAGSILFKRKVAIQSQSGQTPPDSVSASDNDGFHLILDGTYPSLDVIALHGQGGNWKTSWTDPVTGTFWLRDLLPDIAPNARILSFGYGASESSIAIAEKFIAKLVELRRQTSSEQRPIIFLAHSFGGMLIKGILANSQETHGESGDGDIAASTWSKRVARDPGLKRDFRWLQQSNAVYSQICRRFITKYFVESADGVSVGKVKAGGEAIDVGSLRVISLGKTHGQMIRFANADDVDFKKVSKIFSVMVAEVAKQGEPLSS